MATLQKQVEVVNKIIELKHLGIAQSDIAQMLKSLNMKPPSAPTIRKYYRLDDATTASGLASPFQKEKVFDDPLCREIIIKTLLANLDNKAFRISSLYDLLEEELVDGGVMEVLPGNQQTLRNYCAQLRESGQIPNRPTESRLYNFIEDPPPGVQIQLDYGVQRLNSGEHVHFVCIRMRRSRLMFVRAQDHRFTAVETCQTLYLFFILIEGRTEELVIDQDSSLVASEILGEIIETREFKAFLIEQNIRLRVLHKADPESKGSVENLVGFVKMNYFSSRLDQPIQKLIAGIPLWCKRKNTRRLNRATHRIPMEQFLSEEKGVLRPNLPSNYGCSNTLVGPVHVDKMRVVVYKTNKYSVPPAYRFKEVYYRINSGSLSIYDDEQGTRLIRQHDVAPPEVKHQVFMHDDDKRLPSRKWEEVKRTLVRRYPCPNMPHFLNGVCKENERYREPQLSAILAWLDARHPRFGIPRIGGGPLLRDLQLQDVPIPSHLRWDGKGIAGSGASFRCRRLHARRDRRAGQGCGHLPGSFPTQGPGNRTGRCVMDARPIAQTKASLATVGFKHIVPVLAELINIAEERKLSYREFLNLLIDKELVARNEKHRKRNLAGAHFPPNPRSVDEFDTRELEGGITPTQLYQLKDLNWIDAHVNILFLGPPGIGKTMLAVGLGLEAVNAGYSVCFERMASLMEIVDTARTSRASNFRLRRIRRADLVIVDEIGFTPIRRDQANSFFNLVSEMYEKTSMIFTTNKEIGQWAEVMGDPVLTTALLDRILHHSKCFSLRGESCRIKHPQEELPKH